jgi:hypothetical protein
MPLDDLLVSCGGYRPIIEGGWRGFPTWDFNLVYGYRGCLLANTP